MRRQHGLEDARGSAGEEGGDTTSYPTEERMRAMSIQWLETICVYGTEVVRIVIDCNTLC